jgi:hypothetical protein
MPSCFAETPLYFAPIDVPTAKHGSARTNRAIGCNNSERSENPHAAAVREYIPWTLSLSNPT